MELLRVNQWMEKDGTIYFIYKREDLADMLGICTTTVWKAMKQHKFDGQEFEKIKENYTGLKETTNIENKDEKRNIDTNSS